jgi:hypothetical protein
MAQSAAKRTPLSAKKRKVEQRYFPTARGKQAVGRFVTVYSQRKQPHQWWAPWKQRSPEFAEWKRRATNIYNRGLARSSWAWGLKKLGKTERTYRPEINGVVRAGGWKKGTLEKGGAVGHFLENKLAYLSNILPVGFIAEVVTAATNKILAQAALKLSKQAAREMERGFSVTLASEQGRLAA